MLPIQTKLIVPRVTPDFVPRPRLDSRLDAGLGCKLTLVSAPPGFGKTTLLSSWLESRGLPAAWVTLDSSDDDLTIFFWYLIAAVRTVYPDSCKISSDMLESTSGPTIDVVVATLANDLATLPGEIVLVLDDLHCVVNLAVHEVLDRLVGYLPPSVHLMLGTRTDPALSLASLGAHGHLVEVRERDLTFTADEVKAFLSKAGKTDEVFCTRASRAEGWAAGLRLVTLADGPDSDPLDEGSHLRGDFHALAYLAGEVLRKQPPEVQEFLLKAAIVGKFSAELCYTVEAAPDVAACEALIERTERDRLFVTPLGQGWFRFHQLFQKLLHERALHTLTVTQVAELHRRAANWHERAGMIHEAIRHALEAGDFSLAVRLVASHRLAAVDREQFYELERWISLFKPDQVSAEPILAMSRAIAQYIRMDLAEAHTSVCRVSELLEQVEVDNETNRTMLGEIAALQGESAYYRGDFTGARQLEQRALDLLPAWYSLGRAVAYVFLALAVRQLGEPDEARRIVSEGLADESRHGEVYAVRLITAELMLSFLDFDLPVMERSVRRLVLLGRHSRLAFGGDWSQYLLGRIAYLRGHIGDAKAHFEQVAARRYVTHGGLALFSLLSLSLVNQAAGDEEDARRCVEEGASLIRETGNEFLQPSVESFRALLALLQGRTSEAADWAATYDRSTPFVPSIQCEFAPLTFVKTQLALATPASLQEAAAVLAGLESALRKCDGRVYLIEVLALKSRLLDLEGNTDGALSVLEESTALAGTSGAGRAMADLGRETGRRVAALLQTLGRRSGLHSSIGPILAAIGREPIRPQDLVEPLTRRELEVLSLLAKDMQNKEIGSQLFISPKTVEGHTLSIYRKLGAVGRRDAVIHARDLGILLQD